MNARFIIIGNPENRRVSAFAGALAEAGMVPPAIVSWLAIARDGVESAFRAISDARAFVRIDSFGENAEVEAELLRLGLEDAEGASVATIAYEDAKSAVAEHGRIVCPRQAHFGFLKLLSALDEYFQHRPNWLILNQPAAIADLFDKRKTSALYAAQGIRVPHALSGPVGLEALRSCMSAENVRSAYVKLSSGSSASCLAIYQRSNAGEHAMTTVELAGDKLFNSLRVRRVERPRDLEAIISFLLREGSQVEVTVPKARMTGHYFDLRILVIARDPAFTVVRQSRHPITNLHLGGHRGDLQQLEQHIPPEKLEEARNTARRVSEQHDTLHVGVDVLLHAKTFDPYVLEANAFGDLLPNLQKDGRSVYASEIAQATAMLASPNETADS